MDGLSLQGSLYSKELWNTEIASPFRANGRSLHFQYNKGNCLGECKEVPNSSLCWYQMKTGKLPYGQQTSNIPFNIGDHPTSELLEEETLFCPLSSPGASPCLTGSSIVTQSVSAERLHGPWHQTPCLCCTPDN